MSAPGPSGTDAKLPQAARPSPPRRPRTCRRLTQSVHSLERGRVNIQYRPGLSPRTLAQLETLAEEDEAYHVLLFENETAMPFEVAATAWTKMLGCPKFSTATFDAVRAFRAEYVDKGPAFLPE